MARILVVDDERSMREFLEILLAQGGAPGASPLATPPRRWRASREGELDLVITDLGSATRAASTLLEARARQRIAATEVVMITAFATTENAIQAMKLGAYDYVPKPFKNEELGWSSRRPSRTGALLAREPSPAPPARRAPLRREDDPRRVPAIARGPRAGGEGGARRGPPCSIIGESGTGQGAGGPRHPRRGATARDAPFVAINCGAIPEGLVESELFGHVKGSFTGAVATSPASSRRADSGTLFLDEIGELPPPVQVKLLRVLQERRIRPVGGTATSPSRRAHHRRHQPRPRGRGAGGPLPRGPLLPAERHPDRVPPLRERRERRAGLRSSTSCRASPPSWARRARPLAGGGRGSCAAYDWPGNVRELENVRGARGDALRRRRHRRRGAARPLRGRRLRGAPAELCSARAGWTCRPYLDAHGAAGPASWRSSGPAGIKTEAAKLLASPSARALPARQVRDRRTAEPPGVPATASRSLAGRAGQRRRAGSCAGPAEPPAIDRLEEVVSRCRSACGGRRARGSSCTGGVRDLAGRRSPTRGPAWARRRRRGGRWALRRRSVDAIP